MQNVQEQIGMPLAEFIAEFERQPFELINGERKPKMPGVEGHNYFIYLLYQALLFFLRDHPLGEARVEAAFILPGTYGPDWVNGSRIPDILFVHAHRLADYRAQTPDWMLRPLELIPDLVIEVVSPNDRYSDIDEKVDLYRADGVGLIWVCDPQRRKVRVHTSAGERTLAGEDVLTGGAVLPGFEIALPQLFAPPV